jgi:hypothetical protein
MGDESPDAARQLRLQLEQKTQQLSKSDALLKKVGKMLQDHIDENKKLKERVATLERELGSSQKDSTVSPQPEEEIMFDSQDMDRQVVEDAKWAVGAEIDIVVPAGRLGVNLLNRAPSAGVAIGQIMALPTGEPSPLQGKVPEGAQLMKFDQDDSSEWDVQKVSKQVTDAAAWPIRSSLALTKYRFLMAGC